jgi:hypothetical protein
MSETASAYEGWAIVELLGHRRLCGVVSEVDLFGAKMGRVDVPSDPPQTHFFSGGSVYCMTPTSEAIARALTERDRPAPVNRWELPARVGGASVDAADDDEEDDGAPFS